MGKAKVGVGKKNNVPATAAKGMSGTWSPSFAADPACSLPEPHCEWLVVYVCVTRSQSRRSWPRLSTWNLCTLISLHSSGASSPPPLDSGMHAGEGSGGGGGSGSSTSNILPPEVEEWFQAGRFRLMEACEERNPSIVGDSKKAEEAKQRLASLSLGQDTKGVSFAGDALHHLYFSTKFERRGVLLYWILRLACLKR